MKNVNKMTRAEFNLYCGLLQYAYNFQTEQTGLVCGSEAEAMRDKMYKAIIKSKTNISTLIKG